MKRRYIPCFRCLPFYTTWRSGHGQTLEIVVPERMLPEVVAMAQQMDGDITSIQF